jgi:hypothetical protein
MGNWGDRPASGPTSDFISLESKPKREQLLRKLRLGGTVSAAKELASLGELAGLPAGSLQGGQRRPSSGQQLLGRQIDRLLPPSSITAGEAMVGAEPSAAAGSPGLHHRPAAAKILRVTRQETSERITSVIQLKARGEKKGPQSFVSRFH